MSAPGAFTVGVAGGSGSGKSSLIRALTATLGGDRIAVVRYDAYHADRGDLALAQRAGLVLEAPEALDTELFLEHLATLRAGRPVTPPRYCVRTYRRVGIQAPIEPRPIILVEGVLLLHDPRVRALLDLSIFLDVPDATRVSRRSRTDIAEEGPLRSGLDVYEAIARGAHARYVEPTKAFADLVLLNGARLDRIAEIAATLILERLERRAHAAVA